MEQDDSTQIASHPIQETTMSNLLKRGTPLVPLRAVHLDLKGLPPTPERLMGLLPILKLAGYNAVLAEWEDTFPWTVDERFRGETFYSAELVQSFQAKAAELGIEIIPLVQCLGHMETPLQIADYAHLREVPDRTDCLNPLAAGATELIRDMVDNVLAVMPGLRYFHLGGDEAWSMGTHPDTRAYIEEHGKAALYLQHVEPLLDRLNEKGIRPILWHDMMKEWSAEALARLGEKCDLMVWGYRGTPDNTDHHHRREIIERMAGAGAPLWGAGAFKCGVGGGPNLPPIAEREENMLGWARAAEEFALVGVCATGWSRSATPTYQYAPIDSCLDVLLHCGVILHDGAVPEGGLDACVAALGELGEAERFRARREAMQRFEDICDSFWQRLRALRQLRADCAVDSARQADHLDRQSLHDLQSRCRKAGELGEALRDHFTGLVPDIWTERLVKSRVLAIEAETEGLST